MFFSWNPIASLWYLSSTKRRIILFPLLTWFASIWIQKIVGIADFAPAENSVDYTINATEIEGTTAGHIHFGIEGENGPIIVTLFKYDTPQNQVSESGTITAGNLTGPLQGMQVSDLIDAFNEGNTYANIHTEKNPNGEIRGQIINLELQMNTEEQ